MSLADIQEHGYSAKVRNVPISVKREVCASYGIEHWNKGDAPQREFALCELFNALRWFVRAGCPWRMLPNDLPPWTVV